MPRNGRPKKPAAGNLQESQEKASASSPVATTSCYGEGTTTTVQTPKTSSDAGAVDGQTPKNDANAKSCSCPLTPSTPQTPSSVERVSVVFGQQDKHAFAYFSSSKYYLEASPQYILEREFILDFERDVKLQAAKLICKKIMKEFKKKANVGDVADRLGEWETTPLEALGNAVLKSGAAFEIPATFFLPEKPSTIFLKVEREELVKSCVGEFGKIEGFLQNVDMLLGPVKQHVKSVFVLHPTFQLPFFLQQIEKAFEATEPAVYFNPPTFALANFQQQFSTVCKKVDVMASYAASVQNKEDAAKNNDNKGTEEETWKGKYFEYKRQAEEKIKELTLQNQSLQNDKKILMEQNDARKAKCENMQLMEENVKRLTVKASSHQKTSRVVESDEDESEEGQERGQGDVTAMPTKDLVVGETSCGGKTYVGYGKWIRNKAWADIKSQAKASVFVNHLTVALFGDEAHLYSKTGKPSNRKTKNPVAKRAIPEAEINVVKDLLYKKFLKDNNNKKQVAETLMDNFDCVKVMASSCRDQDPTRKTSKSNQLAQKKAASKILKEDDSESE